MFAKINVVILQPAENLDLNVVILQLAKNLIFSFQIKNQKISSFGFTASG
jgi:hypothetical protein